jgi:hypothetical protein
MGGFGVGVENGNCRRVPLLVFCSIPGVETKTSLPLCRDLSVRNLYTVPIFLEINLRRLAN